MPASPHGHRGDRSHPPHRRRWRPLPSGIALPPRSRPSRHQRPHSHAPPWWRGEPASRSGRSERVGPEIGFPPGVAGRGGETRVRTLPVTGGRWYLAHEQRDAEALEPAGVGVDGASGKDGSESLEGLAGRRGAPRTAKARDISGRAVKFPCARETGGWGRVSDEGPRQKNSDLSEGPWGREAMASRTAGRAGQRPGLRARGTVHISDSSSEGWRQTGPRPWNVGSDLSRLRVGQAPSEMPALEPYWGKPTVRNLRGEGGDVGIIRSPLRATVLPDRTRFARR